MNFKKMKEKKVILLEIVLSFLLLASINVWAQTLEAEIPAPADEEFQPTDGVITKASSLAGSKVADFSLLDIIRIYNDDKTIWYEFSFGEKSPVFYYTNKKPEFQPFAPIDGGWNFHIRLIAESKHWYEVVVNEETKETKYTLKADRILGRTTFEHYIKISGTITFNSEKNPLRQTPDGELVQTQYRQEGRYYVKKIEGEWMYVASHTIPNSKGWIRWRKDGEMLIGYILNRGAPE